MCHRWRRCRHYCATASPRMGAQSLIIGASFRRPLLSLPVDRPRRRPNHSALTTSSSAARNSGGAEASLALSERCRGTDDGQLVLAIGSELFSQELRKIEIANPNVLHTTVSSIVMKATGRTSRSSLHNTASTRRVKRSMRSFAASQNPKSGSWTMATG